MAKKIIYLLAISLLVACSEDESSGDGTQLSANASSLGASSTSQVVSSESLASHPAGSSSVGQTSSSKSQSSVSSSSYPKPVITITTPTAGQKIVTASFEIKGTVSLGQGSLSEVMFKLGGGEFTAVDGLTTWTKTITPSSYGAQVLTIRAKSEHNQISEATRSFFWDPVRPRAGFQTPLDCATLETGVSQTITITNSDNPGGSIASLYLAINDSLIKTWTDPSESVSFSHAFPADDLYSLKTWALDQAGNHSLTNEIIIESESLLTGGVIEWAKSTETSGQLSVYYTNSRTADNYFVVVDEGYPPTAEQVINGQNYKGGTATASFSSTDGLMAFKWVSGLYSGKAYHVYMVSQDAEITTAVRFAGSFVANLEQPLAKFSDLIFSEYLEGSGNNKALEIYNGTGFPCLISSNYQVELYLYGGQASAPEIINAGFGDVLPNGACYVWAHSSAISEIKDKADKTSGNLKFSGNQVILLRRLADNAIVDSIGSFSQAGPWVGGGLSTQDRTLRRKKSITQADANPRDDFDPSLEWEGFALDIFSGLGQW